jgi:hypothetical protein
MSKGRSRKALRRSRFPSDNPWSQCKHKYNTVAQGADEDLHFWVEGITVSADFALPVLDGRSFQRLLPASSISVLLYAQAERVDVPTDATCCCYASRPRWERKRYDESRCSYSFGIATFSSAEVTLARGSPSAPKYAVSISAVRT